MLTMLGWRMACGKMGEFLLASGSPPRRRVSMGDKIGGVSMLELELSL